MIISLYNFSKYIEKLSLTIPIKKIFSWKGKIYRKEDEGFDSSEDDEEELVEDDFVRSKQKKNLSSFEK